MSIGVIVGTRGNGDGDGDGGGRPDLCPETWQVHKGRADTRRFRRKHIICKNCGLRLDNKWWYR